LTIMPYQSESRLLRAKRVLASRPFSPTYFMGVPLDEFTAPEIAKIAGIAMTKEWSELNSPTPDYKGVYGPPVNPFKKGDTAVIKDPDNIYEGHIIVVEAVINDRVVATWESSRRLGSLYQTSFDYRQLLKSSDPADENDCVIKSEN